MTALADLTLNLISPTPEQTHHWGAALGACLRPGDVVCLYGDLGAGKTLFVAGVGHGWGSGDPVTSPTFVVVNEYHHPTTPARLFHLDCYRLRSGAEALALGFDDLVNAEDIVLIEWAERIHDVLPPEHLSVALRWHAETQRALHFTATGARPHALLRDFQQHLA